MSVGGITSINSMSNMQITRARSTDVKSKSIQNEIKDAQQQMRKLSSNEELSVDEKVNERKVQQKEITSLNAELKRHQEELRSSQRREMMLAKLQEDGKATEEEKTADKTSESGNAEKEIKTTDLDRNTKTSQEETSVDSAVGTSAQQSDYQETVILKNSDGTVILKGEVESGKNSGVDADKKQTVEAEKETKPINDDTDKDTDTGLSQKKVHRMISADASAQQMSLRETVTARNEEGIVVLKGEINQDEVRGVDTDKKQQELEKLEEKEERATTVSLSALRVENNAMNPMANIKVSGIQSKTDDNAVINFSQLSNGDAQQWAYVSFGN